MRTKKLPPCTDAELRNRMLQRLGPIVENRVHLNLNWLADKGFSAIPWVSASHLNPEMAKTLSEALLSRGWRECFALATEPLNENMRCFKVETTANGLMDFERTCAHFNFILLPTDESFAVLCTTDDYIVVAGPADFVSSACGDAAATLAEFDEFAGDDPNLQSVAKRYQAYRP
jgi:hypothetical protein